MKRRRGRTPPSSKRRCTALCESIICVRARWEFLSSESTWPHFNLPPCESSLGRFCLVPRVFISRFSSGLQGKHSHTLIKSVRREYTSLLKRDRMLEDFLAPTGTRSAEINECVFVRRYFNVFAPTIDASQLLSRSEKFAARSNFYPISRFCEWSKSSASNGVRKIATVGGTAAQFDYSCALILCL